MSKKPIKKTKKEKKVDVVAKPIEDLINKAEVAIMITATQGNIEVTGLKNVQYAYTAKGLITGALDSYNIRPTLKVVNKSASDVVTILEAKIADLKALIEEATKE